MIAKYEQSRPSCDHRDSVEASEGGATAVEYAIMVSLIAGVIVLAVGALGLSVSGLFRSFLTAMDWG